MFKLIFDAKAKALTFSPNHFWGHFIGHSITNRSKSWIQLRNNDIHLHFFLFLKSSIVVVLLVFFQHPHGFITKRPFQWFVGCFTLHSQGVSLWRVKSSGIRQSKIYQVTLGSDRVDNTFLICSVWRVVGCILICLNVTVWCC